jgi:hypothetical protein
MLISGPAASYRGLLFHRGQGFFYSRPSHKAGHNLGAYLLVGKPWSLQIIAVAADRFFDYCQPVQLSARMKTRDGFRPW